jgi:hypothetical protein
LQDGRVLLVGGMSEEGDGGRSLGVDVVEIYDSVEGW